MKKLTLIEYHSEAFLVCLVKVRETHYSTFNNEESMNPKQITLLYNLKESRLNLKIWDCPGKIGVDSQHGIYALTRLKKEGKKNENRQLNCNLVTALWIYRP